MSAQLIAKLIEAGTPADLVAEVAMELGRAQAERSALEHKREVDRERQRRRRSREVTEAHATSRDIADTPAPKVPPAPPPNHNPRITPLKSPHSTAEIPEWMPADTWSDFKAMRKAMRNVPFGESAERRVIAKLATLRSQGHDPEKLLSKAIEGGHRTVFADDDTKAPRGSTLLTKEEQIANLKSSIEFYSRIGRDDDVRECRRRIAALEKERPPPAVAKVIQQAVRGTIAA